MGGFQIPLPRMKKTQATAAAREDVMRAQGSGEEKLG